MKRTYKKRALFHHSQLGKVFLGLFMAFIAYRILTPPSDDTTRITSPDGTKTARLKTVFYYENQPSYKIYYQEKGKKGWMGLYSLPAYTNTPVAQTKADLHWSDDSQRLDFTMNGTSIWHHVFQ
jgi:hypothetical protein